MKKYLLQLLLVLLTISVGAQETKYDTTAIYLLDHMSSIIGELNSCTYTVRTSSDEHSKQGMGMVTNFSTHKVMLQGPDKIQVESYGDNGHKGFWYNGEQCTYYVYDENNYSLMEAPSTILETIDTVNMLYGIEFPAADFFYPTFTDDLIDHFDSVSFRGKSKVDDKDCYRVLAKNDDMIAQLWIEDDAMTLPYKLLLMYLGEDEAHQYEATFTNWQLNPDIPNSVFDFLPPPKAKQIVVLPK